MGWFLQIAAECVSGFAVIWGWKVKVRQKKFGPKILRLGDMINSQLLGSYLLSLLNTTPYPKIWPIYGFLMS